MIITAGRWKATLLVSAVDRVVGTHRLRPPLVASDDPGASALWTSRARIASAVPIDDLARQACPWVDDVRIAGPLAAGTDTPKIIR